MKNMELTETQGKESYKNLEKDALERVLVKRIQRLETFVKEVYPQFIGLVECCLWYVLENAKVISACPQHFINKIPKENLLSLMKSCPVCRQMINQLVYYLKTPQQIIGTAFIAPVSHPRLVQAVPATKERKYGGNCHFDEKVITIIQDFEKMIRV